MVHESPYQKALSLTGIMTVMGCIFSLTGVTQMATLPEPNWFLIWFGVVVAFVGAILLLLVIFKGKKYLSTTAYLPDSGYRAFDFW